MTVTIDTTKSIYDLLKPHLDAADLIARLGLELSRTLGSEAYCSPLCHESSSGEALQINLQTGRWNCKACQSDGVYGDLIQLVEYTLSGGAPPTKGSAQTSAPTHKEALTWLCDQFGIAFDENRMAGDPGLDVVQAFAMAAHENLLESEEVLDWIFEKWGFDRATVESYGIGYMTSPILPAIASEAAQASSRPAFIQSGLGWYPPEGPWQTRFEGRITFPYLEHGRAVYLIGRSTPWTPAREDGGHVPKYHKLAVHSETRSHISQKITNDHLYNEPVMATTSEVGIVEGIADGVAISSLGVAVVSPVTISLNATDLKRFTERCHENKIDRIWILFDNELSGSGNFAARREGTKLVEGGLSVKIVTLPLGPEQLAARDEVKNILKDDLFEEFERAIPRDRKRILREVSVDDNAHDWLVKQVNASKIDAAEWCAQAGAGAAGRFDQLRKDAQDVIELLVDEFAIELDMDLPAIERVEAFDDAIELAAHIDERMARDAYCGYIANAAGRGVNKAEVVRRVAGYRRSEVLPARQELAQADVVTRGDVVNSLVLLPPEQNHTRPEIPEAPAADPSLPAAPPSIQNAQVDPHTRYAPARAAVAGSVEARVLPEQLGEYVAQTITRAMGFTPFRTADDLYLVRGSTRIAVGVNKQTPEFNDLLWLASGLTQRKSTHQAYIGATIYFLGRASKKAEDVSWSHVDGEAIYFPTGDEAGHIIKIEPGQVTETRMSDARVPAVAGPGFSPFRYTENVNGIDRAMELFRWTSISPGDRLILVHWIACLPILRRIGTIPIVRIEGGSSSGKTRTVDAVSYLVNGRKSSSVPTAAAMTSRLASEMLTIDDNREASDVSPDLLRTLLQVTHQGAREKRRNNSDTGTIIERFSGALIMNGIEPIHDGKSEIVSRILTLRSHVNFRRPDSPSSELELKNALVDSRNDFWSESCRRCAIALDLDRDHGEHIGAKIQDIFGTTRIGRLSSYLRMMYFVWCASGRHKNSPDVLQELNPDWVEAFELIAAGALQSLLSEELSVTALRYIFNHGIATATRSAVSPEVASAFDGKFVIDYAAGWIYLREMRATKLARLARMAGKELNAPRQISSDLRSGQLEQRLLDGVEFIKAAGYEVSITSTIAGKTRFSFARPLESAEGGEIEMHPRAY